MEQPPPRRVTIRTRLIGIRSVDVEGLQIFYREAGAADAPHVLLLHGFPTSSHMFRNLISTLADGFHLMAPDYPGFGNSSMPVGEFEYRFDQAGGRDRRFHGRAGLDGMRCTSRITAHRSASVSRSSTLSESRR